MEFTSVQGQAPMKNLFCLIDNNELESFKKAVTNAYTEGIANAPLAKLP